VPEKGTELKIIWDPNLNSSGGTSRKTVHERYHDDDRDLTKRTDAAVVGG